MGKNDKYLARAIFSVANVLFLGNELKRISGKVWGWKCYKIESPGIEL